MLTLTDEQLDWLAERVPEAPLSPLGGRPATRQASGPARHLLDLGQRREWKDLPREFGSKSAVHRWFKEWVQAGVFEGIMRDAGQLVEERDGYRLYECFIDGTFCKARAGRRHRAHQAGKGVKSWSWSMPAACRWPSRRPPPAPTRASWCSRCLDFMLTLDMPHA